MIVLAIAGLILAVVFIAVPALTRSQNNQARAADRNLIITGLNNVASNTGGRLPADEVVLANAIDKQEVSFIAAAADGTIDAAKVDDIPQTANLVTDFSVGSKIWYMPKYVAITAANKVTFTNGQNGLVIIGQARCQLDVVTTTGTGTNVEVAVAAWAAALSIGQRNSVAWLYMVEGDDNVYCEDGGN